MGTKNTTAPSSAPSPCILIIETEDELVNALKEQLSSAGYKVFVATKTAQAMSMLQNQTFSGVVIDLDFEDHAASRIITAMKADEKHANALTPVIALSREFQAGVLEAIGRHLRAAVVKPYDASLLLEKVRVVAGASVPATAATKLPEAA